ncbi:LutC/YkgG family protein [Niallia endozanthoxylica]|uniref:Lactate utilization protein C n=1 Tax=Niallia endozanthoxylica TaxID=2036016 RepID=A0A5J5HBE2_9BACI|nr:lactate utilization protein C [Niallia endozanthoxylica]KAA9018045.1 lactate utilization protein C [Niallia endozanthoxylica]
MQGTIKNREAFLEDIANRLGRERKTYVKKPNWAYNPQEEVLKGATKDELLDVLKLQCTKVHTKLVVTTKETLPEILKGSIEAVGGGPIVTWKDKRFEQFGLGKLLKEDLPSDNVDVFEWNSALGKENIVKAERANVGITISEITLAESGTVVLYSSKDRGRTISFLPTNSIVIVPKSTIVPRMTQAAKILREKIKQGEQVPSCINYITGPSNSADIELNLVVGVHGPVKMKYIVVEDL